MFVGSRDEVRALKLFAASQRIVRISFRLRSALFEPGDLDGNRSRAVVMQPAVVFVPSGADRSVGAVFEIFLDKRLAKIRPWHLPIGRFGQTRKIFFIAGRLAGAQRCQDQDGNEITRLKFHSIPLYVVWLPCWRSGGV
ncbi:hypothetical protein MnTg04_01619 [bacterium MnTg04]|nr:hypothetical protein MnTg04_01619 [bacterium MnTg04]